MQIYNNTASWLNTDYPLEKLGDPAKLLFLDIETTGLSAQRSFIYLIGTAYLKDGSWNVSQFFAENPQDEPQILFSFLDFLSYFDTVITFNGNRFDIPFIEARASMYGYNTGLSCKSGIDIYRRIKPYKRLFGLADMKQKSIEHFMNIERTDEMSGGELIGVYESYTREPSQDRLDLLLRHNFDDVCGMVNLLPVLSYSDIINNTIKADRAIKNNYTDYNGEEKDEIIIEFTFDNPVPVPVSYGSPECYLMLGGNRGKIRIPIIKGELKYFYPDFSDYYYLPEEDTAIHKSVATYVDRAHREQATAENCYVKHKGLFLPEWVDIITPAFKENYNDKLMYFELTDELKQNPEAFTVYARHLIEMILAC